ncbi:hypothetical protein ACLNCV_03625 [Streptococcus sp. CL5.50]|jgi:hypothetical protein|uniref:DNA-binding protein n=1 Tax=Streptococcus mitis TaxID=28037 RepID=A0A1X1KWG5_STRMT|nr:hypothetical protein [Streptococcus mitis]MCC0092734.1 hypothetical protein [Streptococcus mitis]MCY7159340.1 hypothetical protein [Streptococcus mitis]ORP03806.1 hypothetical protein B7694_07345 [Streptococcus mitis]RSK06824.1 hypothetical protein D8787_02905 [Streptococcus mitis]
MYSIPQGILSQEAELALLERIEHLINDYLSHAMLSPHSDSVGLIQQKELIKELGISLVTLHEWERLGLTRYCPPIEGTRKVFYKKSDVMKFLSITRRE